MENKTFTNTIIRVLGDIKKLQTREAKRFIGYKLRARDNWESCCENCYRCTPIDIISGGYCSLLTKRGRVNLRRGICHYHYWKSESHRYGWRVEK